jgi:CBS-domain-containing membrane protein
MAEHESIQRVRIYLSERDIAEGQPLYLVVLERLRREGATGATALRGVAGFGPGQRLRTAGAADLGQSRPVVIEWVDRAERIARAMPALDDLLPDALITIEDLRIYRAVLRSVGPFGERSVGEVMARDTATARPQATSRAAAELLLERRQALLPILDDRDIVVGVIAGGDLVRHGGLLLHPRLIDALAPPERAALLDALPDRTIADVMTAEPRTVYVEASIPQAIGMLVEWGLEALPVTDREGRFAGLFNVEQALRAALEARGPSDGGVRDAEPPTSVRLVMQTTVPTIAAAMPAADALRALLAAPRRFLVAVDDGRPVGILTDVGLLGRLQARPRAAWLAALRAPDTSLTTAFEFSSDQRAGDLASPAPVISALATQDEATRLMLDGGHERLVVLDEAGRLAGLLARRGLLRALAQESAG